MTPTIPVLSATTADMGTTITIKTQNNALIGIPRHVLTYKFGSALGDITTPESPAAVSTNWTVPFTTLMMMQIPNATSGTCTITCTTYDWSKTPHTLIGTKTVNLTVTLPASVKPAVSAVDWYDTDTNIKTMFGNPVQNRSRIHFGITASAGTGTTIKSYSTGIEGKTYSGSSFTSDLLRSSGAHSIVTTVTDNRNRTATYTTNINVLAYTAPKVTKFKVERCNASGSADPSGENARLTLSASAHAVGNKNTMSVKLWWKTKSAQFWSSTDSITLTVSSYASNYTNTRIVKNGAAVTFDSLVSYDFKVEVTDFFETVTSIVTISTTKVLIDFKADGTGIALGKVSEDSNTIELGMAAVAKENVTIKKNNPYLTFNNTQAGGGEHFFHSWVSGGSRHFGLHDSSLTGSEKHVMTEDSDGSIHFPVKPLGIGDGGTGATTAAAALTNLGAASADHVQDVAHGGTGATTAAAARDALQVAQAVPHTSPAAGKIVVTGNTGGFGTSDAANKFWYLWDWQDGSIYPCSLHPGSNGVQSLGHPSYRIKNVYANNYVGGNWQGNAVPVANGGTGATTLANALKNLSFRYGEIAVQSVAANSVKNVDITLGAYASGGEPMVITGMRGNANAVMGGCSVLHTAFSVSSTGTLHAQITLANNTSGNRNIGAYWIAIGGTLA